MKFFVDTADVEAILLPATRLMSTGTTTRR